MSPIQKRIDELVNPREKTEQDLELLRRQRKSMILWTQDREREGEMQLDVALGYAKLGLIDAQMTQLHRQAWAGLS